MSLDPLTTTQRITDNYRNYLRSSFSPRQPELANEFEQALAHAFRLTRGPYLQADPPFVAGASVNELITEGVLTPGLEDLAGAFPVDRPLYRHQEQAIRKSVGLNRNLVVSTGTGSGKTECFLLPIIDGLMKEREEGTLQHPGVRALLLYPMNALANDQVKRLRRLLGATPDITFGRYVGETVEGQVQAEDDFRNRYPSEDRLDNELISREVMRDEPPHILLTNYAMLEYLLLRPQDSTLFDGPTGDHWRYLVLDEAHIYNGAQGTEVAMLLRRLRDRVIASEPGRIRCFATSATLGRGREDFPALVEFAESLFAEPFEWDDDEADRQDIVVATRRSLVRQEAGHELPQTCFADLQRAFRSGATATELAAVLISAGADAPEPPAHEDASSYLFRLLAQDKNVIALQSELEQGSVELNDIAARVFTGPSAREDVVALIDLAVAARSEDDDAALIPARYHFFLRSLEGAFVCLHPNHRSGESQLVLQRFERCPSCTRIGRQAAMFELGVCRNCGAGYLVGNHEGAAGDAQILKTATDYLPSREYYVLGRTDDPTQTDDDDEAATGVAAAKGVTPFLLCPSCGTVSADGKACRCHDRPAPIPIGHVDLPDDDPILHSCVVCASRTSGEVVTRFVTGTDAPVAVIATDLYQQLPASRDPKQSNEVGGGRKLLTFSDSRQDAAFFAPYLERTYQRAVQRRLISGAIAKLAEEEPPRFEDIVTEVRRRAEDCLVLDPDESAQTNKREASAWLALELMAIDRRQSLEGTGTAEIALAFPRNYEPPRALADLGMSPDESLDLIQMLLETVRAGGAVTQPEGVDITDVRFEPKNREYGIRGMGSTEKAGVLAWSPASALNRRLDILTKVFTAKAIEADPRELLEKFWRHLTDPNTGWDKVLEGYQDRQHGALWRLRHERFQFLPVADDHRPYRCRECHRVWWRTVAGICPTWRCGGQVAVVEDLDALKASHYARLYESLDPIGMAVQEHTAQWNATAASRIQDDFVSGRVNVLSCSTTFELGVDVGEVETVLLRNVPPRPANYVQRAGRAGRRTDSAALVVTFAQRRNHDLSHFGDPRRMVDGTISPPSILLENPSIVRRHVHSLAFAAFERRAVDGGAAPHMNVAEFFRTPNDDGVTPVSEFVSWLESHPDSIGQALDRVVPTEAKDRLGLADWTWVDALVRPSDDDPTHGWLGRATDEVTDELDYLDELIDEAYAERNARQAGRFEAVRRTVSGRHLPGFLASRNVLPKYGFPVDVVELNLSGSGDADASRLELTRDLSLAISDYAPGSQVVAAKRLWKSRGVVVRANRGLPSYHWATCLDCGAFRQHLERVPEQCQVCGSDQKAPGKAGSFVTPIFGFVGGSASKTGESRPPKMSSTETYFGSYRDEDPPLQRVDGLDRVEFRASRQGRISVVNRGPRGRGFRICNLCGFGEPAPARAKKSGPAEHDDIRRPGRKCPGNLNHRHFGHEYLTDVIEIRFDVPMDEAASVSTLYALLEATPALQISRDDVDGTQHRFAPSAPMAFVLFDTVPGGAGHAQRIAEGIPKLIEAALAKVQSCECGKETACYNCLRGYSNQRFHDRLSRGAAEKTLLAVLGRDESRTPLLTGDFTLLADEVKPLVKEAVELGAPPPEVGYPVGPLGSGWELEAAWPDAKVAIVTDVEPERDAWLADEGWESKSSESWTAGDLSKRLTAVRS